MEISSRSGALGAFAVDGILAKLTLFIAPRDAFEYAPANCECFDPLGVFESVVFSIFISRGQWPPSADPFGQVDDFLVLLVPLHFLPQVSHRSVENETDVADAQAGDLADFLIRMISMKAQPHDLLLVLGHRLHMFHETLDGLATRHLLKR